jgi:hypothetical protein
LPVAKVRLGEGTALQVEERLFKDRKKCQGTTGVVP